MRSCLFCVLQSDTVVLDSKRHWIFGCGQFSSHNANFLKLLRIIRKKNSMENIVLWTAPCAICFVRYLMIRTVFFPRLLFFVRLLLLGKRGLLKVVCCGFVSAFVIVCGFVSAFVIVCGFVSERCKCLTVIVELACFESRVQVSKPGSGCPGFSRPFLLHSALSVSGVQFPLITRPERSRDSTCSIDTARAFTGVASCLEI